MNSYRFKNYEVNLRTLFLKIVFLLLSISMNLSVNLLAQWHNIRFQRISIEEGLSQSDVYCILQDSRGFMWFGTEDGLNKYDGYKFKVYKSDLENPNSLSYDHIRAIYEDKSGAFWIGTYGGGLNKLDPKKEQFFHYQADSDDHISLSNNFINSIYEDRSGVLWIGTEGGLNKLVPSERERSSPTFIQYRADPNEPNSLSNDRVMSIYEDRSGVLWIGTYGGGLNKLISSEKEQSSPTFIHYQADHNDPNSLSSDLIRSIYEDRSGVLWIGTESGLNKLVPGEREGFPPTFIRYQADPNDPNSLSSDLVRTIYEDRSGVLWIGTYGGGLNKLVPSERERSFPIFIHCQADASNPNSLSNNRVMSIYEDRSGVLWVGTDIGLNKFDQEKKQFILYQSKPNDPSSLSNNFVRPIYEDRLGVLWIGTYGGGLNKLVPSERERSSPIFIRYQADPGDPDSLSSDLIRSIYEDRSGVLWIGTESGLNKLVPSEREGLPPTFIHYQADPGDPTSLSNNFVLSIYEDKSGILWIGTAGGGLNKLVPSEREGLPPTFIRYQADPGDSTSLSNNFVYSIYEDRLGVLWIGTFGGGLNKLVPSEREGLPPTFIRYQADPDDPTSLSNNFVLSIYEDKSGILWIGTAGGGLNKLVPGEREGFLPSFIHYREREGLLSSKIYGILEDENGNLWLSHNKGISRFNPHKETFKNYDVRDGLQSNEFNGGAYHKSQSGEMFFGGINGFNSFYPEKIRDNPHIPVVVITDFQIFNQSVPIGEDADGSSILNKSISETEEIKLTYRDRSFSFEFAALHYAAPEKNEYAYMMDGFEKDWNYVGNRRFSTYTNLHPGDYVFRVKGSNNDGVWNEKGVSLKIKVAPPLWQTLWFRGSVIMAILLVIFSFNQIRTHNIRKRSKQLEERVKSRTIELKSANEELQQEINERKKAEEEIEKRQKYLESVLYNTPNAIVTADASHRIVDWNPGAEKIFGYSSEEVIGKNVDDLIANSDVREEAVGLTKKILSGQRVSPMETIRYRKDGVPVSVILAGSPIKIGDELHGVVIVYTDISKRKQAEARYRSLFEEMPVGLYRTNPDGKVLDANPALAKMLGHRNQKEYLSHGEVDGYVNAEDRKHWQYLMEKEGEVSGFEVKWRTRDGRVIWIRESARAVRNAMDDVIYYEGVAEDITERKQAEEELAEERNLLRKLMDNLPDVIFIKDTKSRFVTTNTAHLKIMGKKTLDEVIGKTDFDFFPREFAEQYYADEQFIIESKRSLLDREERLIDSHGRERWFLTDKLPFLDKKGSVIGVIGISHDITKRKILERQLEDFAYIASHDLKAPMRAVNQLATWISEDYADAFDEEGKVKMNLLMSRVKRMNSLIEGILQYTKAGRIKEKKEEVNLGSIIKKITENLAQPDNIQVTIEDKLPVILADKMQVKQIFRNLIDNAIKFMDKQKGEIRVGCADEGMYWKISVTDNGPGIDEKYYNKIFQIFQTLESRDERESTGAGLSVAKKIVELYGGKIWVESKLGEGSTFFFTLKKEGGKDEK